MESVEILGKKKNMSKEKLIICKNYDGSNNLYFTVYEEGNVDLSGVGYTKKSAIEDYEENKRTYERLMGNRSH